MLVLFLLFLVRAILEKRINNWSLSESDIIMFWVPNGD
jgi:hypothetical protein